jgi:SAM-dependent methyltransferase
MRRHHPAGALAACWRQWRCERSLRRRGIHFRHTDPNIVAAAYAAMTDEEFDAINAPQDWANWRTIPRALNGHVPDRPLQVTDLGCGTGSSTRVLAFYCPPGSSIVGYEMVEALLARARRRTYLHRNGRTAAVEFVCQPLTAPFHRPDGSLVADCSIDLVNASGVVGHHLDAERVRPLIVELQRVLATEGIAMLDAGPALTAPALTAIMALASFELLGRYRSWFLDPTGELVFRRVLS